MARAFIWIFTVSLFFVSCKDSTTSNSTAAVDNVKDHLKAEQKEMGMTNDSPEISAIKNVLTPLLGSNMIEDISLNGDHLEITYFKNLADYNKMYPKSTFEEAAFNQYWELGNKMEKTMILVPAQILNKNYNIKSVNLNIHSNGEKTTVRMTRDDLTTFTGKTWEQLQEGWDGMIRAGIIRNPEKRAELFNKIKQ